MIKITDAEVCVATKEFPFAKFNFECFNPIQSKLLEIYKEDCNIVISSKTSTGKTQMAEIVSSYILRNKIGKVLYLAPFKALTQQNIDSWRDGEHHFGDLKISVCSGDYRLTADRKEELDNADIILMTSEMVNSASRNDKADKNQFLKDIKLIVVDEAHGIADASRGSHLEVGLMKFSKLNPEAKIVFLSATMPNAEEVAEWVEKLNLKKTYLLESNYRPVPLNIWYEKYWDGGSYDDKEKSKINYALSLIESYPDDKFLIFVHGKATGELIKKQIKAMGHECEFHNSDLDKAKRIKLEDRFRKDPEFKYVVATSTLSAGINMPARRVIVVGVHRGLEEVDSAMVIQESGRAGRKGLDPCGDAYVLLPESQFDYFRNKFKKSQKISSRLLENVSGHHKTLAFHLVSEIHHGNIKSRQDIKDWFVKSLACHQSHDLSDDVLEKTVDLLKKCGAIVEQDDEFGVTSVGKISSMFYYSPFDVADLKNNFTKLFSLNKEEDEDHISWCFGDVDGYRYGIMSRSEKEEMGIYYSKTKKMKSYMTDSSVKMSFIHNQLLHGRSSAVFGGLINAIKMDINRTMEVINAIDTMSAKWNKKDYFKILSMRLRYGVKKELIHLCNLPNIGKIRAEKLWNNNLRTFSEIINNPEKVQKILNLKKEIIDEICQKASTL